MSTGINNLLSFAKYVSAFVTGDDQVIPEVQLMILTVGGCLSYDCRGKRRLRDKKLIFTICRSHSRFTLSLSRIIIPF